MSSRTHGGCQRFFNRPFSANPVFQRGLCESLFFCPLQHAHRSPLKSDQMIRTPVSHLLSIGRPNAIIGRIPSIVILPLYGPSSGAWRIAHIARKILESITPKPAVAYSDSAPAVVEKLAALLVVAALLHLLPDTVHSGTSPAVARHSLSGDVSRCASARSRMAATKVTAGYGADRTTSAIADPEVVECAARLLPSPGVCPHHEPLELPVFEIFDARGYRVRRHADAPCSSGCSGASGVSAPGVPSFYVLHRGGATA